MYNSIKIKIESWEIDLMLESFVKDKLGQDVDVSYIEFLTEKIKNKHILNGEDNEFSLFVEYNRGE